MIPHDEISKRTSTYHALIVGVLAFGTGIGVEMMSTAVQFPSFSKPSVSPLRKTAADEYAVYSALINEIHNEGRFRVFVIRDHTAACLRIGEWCATQYINDLPKLRSETLNDYLAQNEKSQQLSNSFNLRTAAVLLGDQELPELLSPSKFEINLSPIPSRKVKWGEFYVRYPLSPGLISLSEVGFNSEMNQALVYEETQGNDNGTWGRYLLLTKRAGHWEVEDKTESWFPEEPLPSVKQGEFGTLKGRILDAKAEGQNEVELSLLACGWDIGGLRDALSRDTVLLAEVVGQKTYANTYGLYTWYRFKIIETFSERPFPKRLGYSPFSDPPVEMLPIERDEFLIQEANGRLEIDGVMVTQRSNGAAYSVGRVYLLFLNLDPSKHVAVRSATDPLGVFSVDADGTLRAYIDRSYPLKDQIAKRFGNSVDKLRRALKN